MSCPASASAISAGTAKSGVPMKIRRMQAPPELSNVMRRLFVLGQRLNGLALLRRFLEALHHHVALELGDVVDEQDAVGVIDLVLQTGGKQASGLDLLRLAVETEIFDLHRRWPLDLFVIFGN